MARISLENVTIDFPVFNADSASLKKTVFAMAGSGAVRSLDNRHVGVRALSNLSLDIRDGDRVGLIGLNGAGKSTLLRVMAGIYAPTSGQVMREGRIASLFDVAQGLDQEASGYQNIILKGLYLGFRRREIERRINDIVAFTELDNYLAMPVRTYSTGMAMRLALGVITCMEPEIVLMDEWIGVGDTHFLRKAKDRLQEFVGRSNIMVLASHSEELIQETCNRGLLLNQGHKVAYGPVDDVLRQYAQFGPQPFFDPQAYVEANPDIQNAIANGDTQPWLHFMTYGVLEARDLGNGVSMDQFRCDPVYRDAVARGDNIAALRRVEQVVPFLPTFLRPTAWTPDPKAPVPTDFVAPPGVRLALPDNTSASEAPSTQPSGNPARSRSGPHEPTYDDT